MAASLVDTARLLVMHEKTDLPPGDAARELWLNHLRDKLRAEQELASAREELAAVRAAAALARQETADLKGELNDLRRACLVKDTDHSHERALRREAEEMLGEQDMLTAHLTNELRLVHSAATASDEERAQLVRRLTARQSSARAAANATRELHVTLEATDVELQQAAKVVSAQGVAIARSQDAYAELHRHASTKLQEAAAVAAEGLSTAQFLQREVLDVGMLLLCTHEAIGTDLRR